MLTPDGKIAANGGQFAGMMRYDARIAIEKELERLGLYRGKQVNKMRLGLCQRSGDIIEPMLTPQWYVNCNGSYTTSPGLLALSYTNTATFSKATSITGVMKVKFTSAGCVTNPDWTDKNGASCKMYIDNDFCNASNATGYGFGWKDNFGLERRKFPWLIRKTTARTNVKKKVVFIKE